MAEEALSYAGLYLDELNKIRLLEPESAQQTAELKNECKDFVERILDFQKIVKIFTQKFDELSKIVEKEKMKAIGSRNLAQAFEVQREGQAAQIRHLYMEKTMELERLRKEHDSLAKKEAEQTEFIQQFTAHK